MRKMAIPRSHVALGNACLGGSNDSDGRGRFENVSPKASARQAASRNGNWPDALAQAGRLGWFRFRVRFLAPVLPRFGKRNLPGEKILISSTTSRILGQMQQEYSSIGRAWPVRQDTKRGWGSRSIHVGFPGN